MSVRTVITFLGSLSLLLLPPLARPDDLPNLGSTHTLEQHMEGQYISELFLHELYPHIIHDPELGFYLQTLGNRLVLSSPQMQDTLRFHLLDDKEVNAFAVPGGFIGVNAGLFLLARNESELAGVMAHEIAHIAQKHYQRDKAEAARVALLDTAALLAALQMMSSSSDPHTDQMGTALIMGSLAMSNDRMLKFSREHEEEADRLGMDILVSSGFDPMGMPNFFSQLEKASQVYPEPPEFMSTHPITEARIADTRFRAKEKHKTSQIDDSLQFQLMKVRLRVLTSQPEDKLLQQLQHELRTAKGYEQTALRYGIAMLYLQAKDYRKALQGVQALQKNHPGQSSLLLLEAKIDLQQYHEGKASANALIKRINFIYSELQQRYPDNYPIVANYATALLQTGQPENARSILRAYIGLHTYPDSAELYAQLAQSEWQLGHQVAYLEATAKYYYWKGDVDGAIRQLNLALQRDDLAPLQRQRLGDLLDRYQAHAEARKKVFP